MCYDKKNWSKKRFAWFYAVLIIVGVVVFSAALHLAQIYESAAFRAMFLLFILLGFIILIRSYTKYHGKTTYVEGFLLCARTGFYFLLILVPLMAIYLSLSPTEVSIIQAKETFGNPDTVKEIMFSTALEMVAGIVLSGICASFLTGWRKGKKIHH